MLSLYKAAHDYGWSLGFGGLAFGIVALYVALRTVPGAPATVGVAPIVRALSPAELTTALDVCEDANTVVVRQVAPSRYQAELQVGQTRYYLTWAENSPSVNIDDSRVGAEPGHRTEPVSTALIACFVMKGAP